LTIEIADRWKSFSTIGKNSGFCLTQHCQCCNQIRVAKLPPKEKKNATFLQNLFLQWTMGCVFCAFSVNEIVSFCKKKVFLLFCTTTPSNWKTIFLQRDCFVLESNFFSFHFENDLFLLLKTKLLNFFLLSMECSIFVRSSAKKQEKFLKKVNCAHCACLFEV
jgi:hypothetical protein